MAQDRFELPKNPRTTLPELLADDFENPWRATAGPAAATTAAPVPAPRQPRSESPNLQDQVAENPWRTVVEPPSVGTPPAEPPASTWGDVFDVSPWAGNTTAVRKQEAAAARTFSEGLMATHSNPWEDNTALQAKSSPRRPHRARREEQSQLPMFKAAAERVVPRSEKTESDIPSIQAAPSPGPLPEMVFPQPESVASSPPEPAATPVAAPEPPPPSVQEPEPVAELPKVPVVAPFAVFEPKLEATVIPADFPAENISSGGIEPALPSLAEEKSEERTGERIFEQRMEEPRIEPPSPVVETALSPEPSPPPRPHEAEGPAEEKKQEPASFSRHSRKDDKPTRKRASVRRKRQKGRPRVREIPVEDLANGVINMLGDGLALIIDSTVSVGTLVSSEISAGARKIVRGTVAGLHRFCRFVETATTENAS